VTDVIEAPRGHLARWVALGVGAVVVALLVLLGTRNLSAPQVKSPLLGKPVPAVAGTTTAGTKFDIGDHRGKWVLVNFFASWCKECEVEHPQLEKFANEHPSDTQLVSVAFDDAPKAAKAFFEKQGGSWPVLVGDTGGIAISFGVTAVPETYLVAPDGTVAAKWIAPVTAEQVDNAIAQLEGSSGTSGAGGNS
jgi:cytochrome c biogenesis protein CcmG/thiol:disulfide interchange protein DsbE